MRGESVEDLEDLDAKEAVAKLKGEFATVNPLDELTRGQLDFPGPIAQAFYFDDGDIVAIQGPVGSGKTTTNMKSRLRRAIMMPRSTIDGVRRYKVLFVRETYRQLWSGTIPSYLETFPKDLGEWAGGRGDPVTHKIRFEDDHGVIEFAAEFMAFGDNIMASLKGTEFTDLDLEEADTVPVETLSIGMGRIDRYPARRHFKGLPRHLQSYGQVVCVFNAPDEDDWTYTTFHDEQKRKRMVADMTAAMQLEEEAAARAEGREPQPVRPIKVNFYNQPGYGEPGCENLHNLGPGFYPRQITGNKLAGKSDVTAKLVYNKVTYLRVGDPVFAEQFNRRIHVSDGPIPWEPSLPLMIGLDQGFKGAAVIAQMHGFYRWRILAELHFPKRRLMAVKFGQLLRDLIDERFPGARIEAGWGDMAGEHGASQAADENHTWNMLVGRAAGFNIRPQRIGTNRLQPRLEAVRAALEAELDGGEPGLLIDPHGCPILIRGFEARYVWTEEVNKTGDKRKVPDKSFTEANVHDGLQYLLLSQHRGDGLSPYAAHADDKRPGRQSRGNMGHNGGPPIGAQGGGLQTGWDVLNPYGRGM
ncbi:hypothetical protein CDO87_03480 [Sagittula sp. P11]|nr:hypothetical protein CDO87_03480 [Sagittula sp. P11]